MLNEYLNDEEISKLIMRVGWSNSSLQILSAFGIHSQWPASFPSQPTS